MSPLLCWRSLKLALGPAPPKASNLRALWPPPPTQSEHLLQRLFRAAYTTVINQPTCLPSVIPCSRGRLPCDSSRQLTLGDSVDICQVNDLGDPEKTMPTLGGLAARFVTEILQEELGCSRPTGTNATSALTIKCHVYPGILQYDICLGLVPGNSSLSVWT